MNNIFSWKDILSEEKNKKYFIQLMNFLYKERIKKKIFPHSNDVFNAFKFTPFNTIKIVLVGQDPYILPQQAHGLAFSVLTTKNFPPSLKNIFYELQSDIPCFVYPKNGCLIQWAKQGVFLLNRILTVEQGKSNSHSKIGWNTFTNQVIHLISKYHKGIIFLLWGKHAHELEQFIDNSKHFILKTSHPSPFSAYKGFFGCKHFSKSNKLLLFQKKKPIIW
ncbi:Uracil-DNA glycosylase [Buchnera aphidicola (Thelaxes suberi)]|uniref:uracil-DNA glycosylase n=1 Tax=Buchnera aphidicola TaxID=9 RepID=UPI0034648048